MGRVRNLKPGFFTNEDLAECSPWSRLCYAGLWTIADREGRLEDRPKRIKGLLFSMDNIDVDPLLGELQQKGFIFRYIFQGQGFIQCITFEKHQNPHFREPSSVIPSPESLGLDVLSNVGKPWALGALNHIDAQGQTWAKPGLNVGKASDEPGATPPIETGSSLPVESTPSLPVESPLGRAEPRTQNPEQGKKSLDRTSARKTADRFDEFWMAYPVKKGRADAENKWRTKGYDAIADRIIDDVKRRKIEDRQWLDGYAPHGSTYVNGRGWEDDVESVRKEKPKPGDDTPDYLVGAI